MVLLFSTIIRRNPSSQIHVGSEVLDMTNDFRFNSMFEDLASNAKNLTCGGGGIQGPRDHRLYSSR